MNYKMILRLCSLCFLIEALFLCIPMIYALCIGEDIIPYIVTIVAIAIVSVPLLLIKPTTKVLYARDGWFIAGAIWIGISIFGAIPYFICKMSPSFIDCLFETISGFTTTGASILREVESLPRGISMWRCLTNWIGGMGVLVFLLAIMPVGEVDMRTLHLLRAESPGPTTSKLVPKMTQTAKILYSLYFLLTLLTFIALLIAGMPVYDAVLHSWATAGTGGFSCKNQSIAFYDSTAINYILGIAMILFSINFTVYFHLAIRQFKAVLKNSEVIFHLSIILISIIAITANISRLFPSIFESIEHAFFQVSTIISTTGFATTNFDLWPTFSKVMLLLLMIMGGCAGSTSGGFKAIRSLILIKTARREVEKLTHPRLVHPIRVSGKTVDDEQVRGVTTFFIIYIMVIILSTTLISIDGFDFMTTFSATISTVNNIGPAFGAAGPNGNYADFSPISKMVMSVGMLIGRLEIYPIIMMFAPSTILLHFNEAKSIAKKAKQKRMKTKM